MALYDKFLSSSLDTADIGLSTDSIESSDLLPLGAKIIGWAGDDPTYFCFLDGYGDTVFAVDPSAAGSEWVYPVAKSFSDFWGLITACRGTEPIKKAWRWSRLRFDLFLKETQLSIKQRSILRAIHNIYAPPAISDPYAYLNAIRQSFDASALKFSPQLAEKGLTFPKKGGFSVSFLSDFNGRYGKEKPGKALPLNTSFTWGDRQWHIPAGYICREGLVLDLCAAITSEDILAYQSKTTGLAPDAEEMQDILQENPFNIDVRASAVVNGRALPEKRGYGITWNPLEDNEPATVRLLEHYDCDRETGWLFLRKAFRWHSKHLPTIQSLSLMLQALPVSVPVCRFHVSTPGERFDFINPITGEAHMLTVLDYTQEVLEFDLLTEYPCQYLQMRYAISPDLPEGNYTLRDCQKNAPLQSDAGAGAIGIIGSAKNASSIGIIGGADGPTAVFLAAQNESAGPARVACSALQYTQPETVTWRLDFRMKPLPDISLEILN